MYLRGTKKQTKLNIKFFVKMQNICNLTRWNSAHISDTFNCYRANINGMWNTEQLGGIYKAIEFTVT